MQERDNIARPADGDGGGAHGVFEDEVPTDDPGEDLAQGRIGIGVGAAGDRQKRGEFGVAQADEGASDTAAAVPVRTKIPAPMMQPIPSAVMLNGPSVL